MYSSNKIYTESPESVEWIKESKGNSYEDLFQQLYDRISELEKMVAKLTSKILPEYDV